MFTYVRRLKFLMVLSAATAMLGLNGCGDSDPVTAPSTSDVGRLMITIHDAPVDDFKEVWLTIESLRLIGAGSGGSGDGEIVLDSVRLDFLALNSIAALIVPDTIAAGSYTKLRLKVSDPEFVRNDDSVFTEPDVKLLANGHVDLNFQQPMVIEPDTLTVIDLDLDLSDGLQIIRTGKGRYQLRPQIFVDLSPAETLEVIMYDAIVSGVDLASGMMEVISSTDSSTVQVQTTQTTTITHKDGSALSLSEVVVGWHVTITGTLDTNTGIVTAATITMTA